MFEFTDLVILDNNNMNPIFNSLGSNYDCFFIKLALKQIFSSSDDGSEFVLHASLDHNLKGKSFLFHKGRDAIEFSLRVLFNLNGDDSNSTTNKPKILTQAFTCYAVEEGIKRAGAIPIYVDIIENSTNLSVETLEVAFAKNKDAKVVLVQHSLGIPADIVKIKKWCLKNNLLLIEDLAQGIGGIDKQGAPLGSTADTVIFSFGRDKIIDAVSGGAVLFRNLSEKQATYAELIMENKVGSLPRSILVKDMLYPLITSFGRKTHGVFIGKIILKLARFFKLITSPTISQLNKLTRMSPASATLALNSFLNLDKQILKRRKLATFYFDSIDNKNIKIVNTRKSVKHGSNLRFSIRVKNVSKLIKLMKKNKIYLSDRWYRSAVDCGKQACASVYKTGQAPNAEKLATEVFNLPTHQNITLEKAGRIVEVLNKI